MLSNKTRSIQMTEFNVSYFNNGSYFFTFTNVILWDLFSWIRIDHHNGSTLSWMAMDYLYHVSISLWIIIIMNYHHRSLSLWNYDHGSSSLWIIIIINHHWPMWPWIMIIINFDHHHHRVLQWKCSCGPEWSIFPLFSMEGHFCQWHGSIVVNFNYFPWKVLGSMVNKCP